MNLPINVTFTDRSTQIRDRLVVGILDERLSKEMQMMDEETLTEQKAVSMIRQAECVDIQSSELRAASLTENVHSVQGNSYAKKGNAEKPWKSSTKLTHDICAADAATVLTLYNSAQRKMRSVSSVKIKDTSRKCVKR